MAAEVQRTDVPIFLTGLGTVQALNSVLVKSRVDGQIKKINFSEGQDVRAGDVLVEIDPEPYQAALNQAQANKLRNEALLENARLDLNRFTRLAATGAASTQQVDTTRALVKQLEAGIQSDQASIYSAQVQLDYSRIRSPLNGRAGTRLIDAGNMVKATDTAGIVIINQLDPIFVTFPLPADTCLPFTLPQPKERSRSRPKALPVKSLRPDSSRSSTTRSIRILRRSTSRRNSRT